MNIVLFMQNNHAGGMDSFATNLINKWPSKNDNFTFICNENHKGINNIKKFTYRNVKFISHEIAVTSEITEIYLNFLPYKIRRLFHPFLNYLLIPYQYKNLKKYSKI